MTQAPNTRPPAPMPPRPGGAPSAGGPAGGGFGAVQIDPVRLVRKYFWILIATGIFAIVAGIGAHMVLARVAPSFRAKATFEAKPPTTNITQGLEANQVNNNQIDRFIGTQAAIMTSRSVLESVANHPQLSGLAPTYFNSYSTGGSPNVRDIVRDLGERTSARPVPKTVLIELSVAYRNPLEATELVRLVRESYQRSLEQRSNLQSTGQRASLRQLRDEADREIKRIDAERNRIVAESEFDTLEDRSSEVAQLIGRLGEELVEIDLQLEALREQLAEQERQLSSDAGIQYGDDLVAGAENNPRVSNLRQQLDSLETALRTFREQGVSDQHRDVQRIHANMAAVRQRIEQTKAEVLNNMFLGQVESTRRFIAQLEAQQADLDGQREEARVRRNELGRLAAQVRALDERRQSFEQRRAAYDSSLQNLNAIAELDAADRIQLVQRESIPDGRAFPQLRVILPATFILICGTVGGLILLREILDQRVKSPSDIAMIPRARVLGLTPDAAEEGKRAGQIETIFRDHPRGVLAESFRQLRGSLIKEINKSEHKSLIVVPASPGSGASTVVCNLGLAVAATHHKVLLVDGNFRRPALHSIFDLRDGPGLADVLMRAVELEDAVQESGTAGLDVLAVGSAESRQFELLSTPVFGEVIRKASDRYDLVLVDAPPAVVTGDGVAMAQRCDASILVARAMNEKRGMIARLRSELDGSRAELLGIIVNAVRAAAGGYMAKNIRISQKYQSGEAVGGSIDRDAGKKPQAVAIGDDTDD